MVPGVSLGFPTGGQKKRTRAVFNTISKGLRLFAGTMIAATFVLQASAADAQTRSQQGRDKGQYIPTIWVDPDGCEHWVMDDGAEGYMTPHVTRQGIPVCRRGNVCGVMNTDQFFKTDSYRVHPQGRARLAEFFKSTGAVSYIVSGHTDSRASDAYNMKLSLNRANAVASIAQQSGARIADVRGYGERMPAASNGTSGGMAKNRRVEIICIR
ncbi:OmpA family protein [Sulfitobacter litoralis]|uniref:OmpA family protein n=2 Tax=Roseobacteraceae TaxID=2854170 RepID=A0ABY0SLZ4_9RHOB|nr:OmpA family protein [Sulfitobacter litoralis]